MRRPMAEPTPNPVPPAAVPPVLGPRALKREVVALYLITLAVTVGLTLAQDAVGWLRSYLLVFVAATFLYLPIEVLHRRGVDPATLGIHRNRPLAAVRAALLLMLVTFPPYLLGFHLWQTQALDRVAAPSEARFDRWPPELEDAPRLTRLEPGEVRLHTADGERLYLRWQLAPGQRFEADLASDPLPTPATGGVRTQAREGALRVDGGPSGTLAIRVPGSSLSLSAKVDGQPLPAERLRLGTARVAADEAPYQAKRGYWWLLNLILVQFLLVAVPEEVFYRGYLQTRLDGLVGRDRVILGVAVNPTSLLLTSALFAIGHVATVPNPARLAVFFPSLIFGWMRRRSDGVLAPAIYHAACNVLVEVAALYYVAS